MWMADSPAAADVQGMAEDTAATADVVGAMVRGGKMAALGELTRGAAHEINNPLFAILTLVDFLLRDAEPGSKTYERLRLVEGSAQDIKAVVERIHRFARSRAEEGTVALEGAAGAAVELVRLASATRTVELVERYPEPPALVAGDAAQLESLFVHLLVNAVQAMPGGGAATVAVDRAGGEVVARISDDGPGIPAADAEQVFELFHTTKSGSGTGLGLASARAIAERHGGTLTLDPGVERGACFVLRLPEAVA